jgi:tetratricopeptide (TPR) repeat protein
VDEAPKSANEGQEGLVSACLETARQYSDKGLHAEAVKVLNAALSMDPDNYEILTGLAAAYCEQEKYDDALPHLQHAHRLNPTDYFVITLMGDALVSSGKWAAAIEQFEILYPLNQHYALNLFRNVFVGFNDSLFSRLLVVSEKYDDQVRGNNSAA